MVGRRELVAGMVVVATSTVAVADSQRQPILGGELDVSLPIGMHVAADRGDDDTYATVELEGTRFELVAYDTYRVAGTDPRAGIRQDLTQRASADVARARISPLSLAKPLQAYEVVAAPSPGSNELRNLIYVAYVWSPRSTIKVFELYVDHTGLGALGRWTGLARRIVASATAGQSLASVAGGEHAFGLIDHQFVVTLPDRWVATGRRHGAGPDSIVRWELREAVPFGSDGASCAIELGLPVRFDSTIAGVADDQVTLASGRVAKHSVTWRQWSSGHEMHLETIVTKASQSDQLHLSCQTDDPARLPPLLAMFEHARLVVR